MSSSRASSERDSVTVRIATKNATIPIGTFRKNTDSQPDVLDHVAAERRPERERDPADPGPQPDRLRALLRRERDGEDRERAGHQERGADALQRPERDQLPGDDEIPHRNEAAVKIASPIRNIFLRP